MNKKFAGIVAALVTSVSLFAMAGPASATGGCSYDDPDLQYACSVFGNLAEREFNFSEASYWAGVGQQYGHTLEALALSHSVEVDSQRIADIYWWVLGRDGDPAGIQYWTNLVASDSMQLETVWGIFSDTAEGQAALTTDEFTTLLYNHFLDREPSNDELAYWSSVAGDFGRVAVARGIALSTEAAGLLIPDLFDEYLGRDATADDVTYWGAVYQVLGVLDTTALIAGSDEAYTNLSAAVPV